MATGNTSSLQRENGVADQRCSHDPWYFSAGENVYFSKKN